MTYFRTQLLSHGTGSLAPPEMAMPVPKATSLYQTIHTAPKADVFTSRHMALQRTGSRGVPRGLWI